MTDTNQELQPKPQNDKKKTEVTLLPVERVVIDQDNIERIEKWLKQATAQRAGIELSVKKLVNWALKQIPEDLESSQLKDLSKKFYDEVKFLELALLQIKQAKTRGETLTLQDVIQANQLAKHPVKSRSKREPKHRPISAPQPSVDVSPVDDGSNSKEPSQFSSVSDDLATG